MSEAFAEFKGFLDSFYLLYDDLVGHDLFLAGDGYAGKFLPLYIHDLLEQNKVNKTF